MELNYRLVLQVLLMKQNACIAIASLYKHTLAFRTLHLRGNSADSTLTEASEVLPRPRRVSPRKKVAAKMRPSAQKLDLNGGQELVMTERDISSFLHPTLNELRKSIKLQNTKSGCQIDLTEAVMKVVVGYLGTIEMPKENQVSI